MQDLQMINPLAFVGIIITNLILSEIFVKEIRELIYLRAFAKIMKYGMEKYVYALQGKPGMGLAELALVALDPIA